MALTAALPGALPRAARRAGALATLRELAALTRPRVVGLVLFTGLPLFRRADGSWLRSDLALGALLGIALAGMSCDALNAWHERDTDALMERTRHRPLPAGRLAPGAALAFGLACGALSVALLLLAGGPLAAALGLATILHYVLVYTAWLKHRSAQAVVIGGAAGAAAPLIASAAATGHVTPLAWTLFAWVFLWTPPHFWAIALYRQREYEAAGIPVLPSLIGVKRTRRRQETYSLLMMPAALALAATSGLLAAGTAVLAGAWFVLLIRRARAADSPLMDRAVFMGSLRVMALVGTAVLLEALLS